MRHHRSLHRVHVYVYCGEEEGEEIQHEVMGMSVCFECVLHVHVCSVSANVSNEIVMSYLLYKL